MKIPMYTMQLNLVVSSSFRPSLRLVLTVHKWPETNTNLPGINTFLNETPVTTPSDYILDWSYFVVMLYIVFILHNVTDIGDWMHKPMLRGLFKKTKMGIEVNKNDDFDYNLCVLSNAMKFENLVFGGLNSAKSSVGGWRTPRWKLCIHCVPW